eukprot:360783-Chlamydomonas_euryale.AAC.9
MEYEANSFQPKDLCRYVHWRCLTCLGALSSEPVAANGFSLILEAHWMLCRDAQGTFVVGLLSFVWCKLEQASLHLQVVVNVCHINGGEAYNVVPDEVTFGGTIRAFSEATMSALRQRLQEVVKAQAMVFNCSGCVDFREDEEPYFPPLVNDKRTTDFAMYVLTSSLASITAVLRRPLGRGQTSSGRRQCSACGFDYGQRRLCIHGGGSSVMLRLSGRAK